ncbi:MAG: hypothetical protein P4L50_13455, partial [Anaerolineaceae bacterium]|nr:hypothetical protein [Anaerolineaceae bacterium]
VPMAGYNSPGAGHLAALIAFNNGNLQNDYLYRVAVPGNPALNTMQTDLNMGNNKITGAQSVALGTASGSAITGNTCSPNGEIASNNNGTGTLLGCVSGKWQGVNSAPFVDLTAQIGSPQQAIDTAASIAAEQSCISQVNAFAYGYYELLLSQASGASSPGITCQAPIVANSNSICASPNVGVYNGSAYNTGPLIFNSPQNLAMENYGVNVAFSTPGLAIFPCNGAPYDLGSVTYSLPPFTGSYNGG